MPSNPPTFGGIELTNELIERPAAEAENGYDVERLRPRPRRARRSRATGLPGSSTQIPTPTKPATPPRVAPSAPGFDLQEITRSLIGDQRWTLDELVAAVDQATPPEAVRAAYRTALRDYVRHQLGARTGQTDPDGQMARAGSSADQDSGPDQSRSDSQTSSVGAGQNVARSRAARFRDLYRAGFRRQVHVGAGVWQPLLDCTKDDLLFAAAECRVMAAGNAAAAERYEELAKKVGAGKVADLSDDIIKGFIQ